MGLVAGGGTEGGVGGAVQVCSVAMMSRLPGAWQTITFFRGVEQQQVTQTEAQMPGADIPDSRTRSYRFQ